MVGADRTARTLRLATSTGAELPRRSGASGPRVADARLAAVALLAALDDGDGLAACLGATGDPRSTVAVLRHLVQLVREQSATRAASKAASAKNAVAREWVASAWIQRSDATQSKSSFAIQQAALVKHQFGVSITPRQIETRWLPKT